jgi:hypothetical protein
MAEADPDRWSLSQIRRTGTLVPQWLHECTKTGNDPKGVVHAAAHKLLAVSPLPLPTLAGWVGPTAFANPGWLGLCPFVLRTLVTG